MYKQYFNNQDSKVCLVGMTYKTPSGSESKIVTVPKNSIEEVLKVRNSVFDGYLDIKPVKIPYFVVDKI